MALKLSSVEKSIGDYVVHLKINEDKTKGYIEISKNNNDGFNFPSEEDIISFLDENGVKFGIEYYSIKNIVSNKIMKATLVALGEPATKGEDAQIIYKHDFSKKINLVQDESGNIDFKSLNWFQQVKQGDILATKIPAQRGIDGKDIKGEPIVAPLGKDIKFLLGKNVGIDDSEQNAVAKADGIVEIIDSKICVSEVLNINGDVDTSVGNIEFNGDIFVSGDIKGGFKVKAEGSLDVKGVIESSDIEVGKDLIVKGGIKGNETTKVLVSGSVICKFIENANVFVNFNINTDFIIHSNVISGGKITLNQKKGVIAGGEVVAKDSIITSTLGSHMGTKTDITLGVDIAKEAMMIEKKNILVKLEKELKRMIPAIETGKQIMGRGSMDDMKKIQFAKSVQEYNSILANIAKIKEDISNLEEEISHHRFSYIVAKDTIYPGVSITILKFSKHINDFLGPSKIYLKGNEVVIEG
ncbi:DUF342 domain-containing protein [Peptoanaerobacter stomatis]